MFRQSPEEAAALRPNRKQFEFAEPLFDGFVIRQNNVREKFLLKRGNSGFNGFEFCFNRQSQSPPALARGLFPRGEGL